MTALVPQPLWPLRIRSGDNPESVRLRKYLTGTNFLVDGVEVAVGVSPRRLVWSRGKSRLYRYEPTDRVRHSVPLVLVYALILRPYILDLVPGRSLVEYLVEQGFDVYLLDWGVPDVDDRGVGIDDYVLDLLPEAVEEVLKRSSADQVTLVGHCQGGTMSAIYAALSPSGAVRNLVLLAAPVDFSPTQPGLLGAWTWLTRQRAAVPSLLAEAAGEAPAHLPAVALRAATRALAATPGVTPMLGALRDALVADEELRAWLGAATWVDDAIPLARRGARQWLRDFYRDNLLVQGALTLRGRQVLLSRIDASVLAIAGTRDWITPLAQARPLPQLVGSEDASSLLVDAGHVGLIVGPTARSRTWQPLARWLGERSGAQPSRP